jgi:hypothetical protein
MYLKIEYIYHVHIILKYVYIVEWPNWADYMNYITLFWGSEHLQSILSNFKEYNTLLFTMVTMVYNSTPKSTPLTHWNFVPLNQYLPKLWPYTDPANHQILLSVSRSSAF